VSLRWRLLLTAVGVVLPLLFLIVWGQRAVARRMTDDLVAAVVRLQFESPARDHCEDAFRSRKHVLVVPRPGGGPFRARGQEMRVDVFFAGPSGLTRAADAPVVAAPLLDAMRGGADASVARGQGNTRHMLVRLVPEDNPCTFALAVIPDVEAPLPIPFVAAPILVVLLAVLIGVAPLVRRIRALTMAVRAWRADGRRRPPADNSSDELGELSRAFRDASDAVAARERDLREFIENVSHDLATPLSVLQGHLSALAARHDPEVLRQAMNEAHYMGALFGSLAVTAKLEAGGAVEDEFDLNPVVARVVDRHRALARRLGVSLESAVPEGPVPVSGDLTFTEQALTNLVGNAVQHNREGGHAAVVLDIVGDEFTLRVLDDGPGITDAEVERVAQRGERGDAARSRHPAGRGLGLSIVARVAGVQKWELLLSRQEPSGLVAELRGALRVGHMAEAAAAYDVHESG